MDYFNPLVVFVGPAKADAFGKYVIADRPPPVGPGPHSSDAAARAAVERRCCVNRGGRGGGGGLWGVTPFRPDPLGWWGPDVDRFFP